MGNRGFLERFCERELEERGRRKTLQALIPQGTREGETEREGKIGRRRLGRSKL